MSSRRLPMITNAKKNSVGKRSKDKKMNKAKTQRPLEKWRLASKNNSNNEASRCAFRQTNCFSDLDLNLIRRLQFHSMKSQQAWDALRRCSLWRPFTKSQTHRSLMSIMTWHLTTSLTLFLNWGSLWKK